MQDTQWIYQSACPPGHDTVMGHMSKHFPDMVGLCFDPEDTKRDGFWLMHRCRERGITPVKVAAPVSFRGTGIAQVNAYPVDLLRERMGT